jgi:hypothetical protein
MGAAVITEAEAKTKWRRGRSRGDYETRYPLSERLADLSIPEPNSGCFLWLGALNDAGYGRIKIRCHFRRAHRLAWELKNGAIPEGLVIDHKCRTRSCVNPQHMHLVSVGQNVKLGVISRSANGAHPFPWNIKHGRRVSLKYAD